MIRATALLPGALSTQKNIGLFSFEGANKPLATFLFGPVAQTALEEAISDGYRGKSSDLRLLHSHRKDNRRYLFAGLGKESEVTLDTIRRSASALARFANQAGVSNLAIRPPIVETAALSAQAVVEGVILGTYSFTQFKSSHEKENTLTNLHLIAKDDKELKDFRAGIESGVIFAETTNRVRDLANTPANQMTPETLAKMASRLSKGQVKVKIFNKVQIQRLGMGALLGVNQGSHKPPFFLHFVYKPRQKPVKKIGICGKGITFDSGGLSLKPAASMETMKYDMTGAATVLSIFEALPKLKLPIEVHGFTPLTENMPGGGALKPGDVVRSLRGKTIEVLNTDAEGRLVLADTLSYASKQDLDEVIDIATLTGACVVALGNSIAAILGNDDVLLSELKNAAFKAGEKIWELPLEKEYQSHLKSKVADLKNIGKPMVGGTIIGGLFLKEFVDEDLPWAHLDIASTGWSEEGTALSPSGSTGVLVRTLLTYLSTYK